MCVQPFCFFTRREKAWSCRGTPVKRRETMLKKYFWEWDCQSYVSSSRHFKNEVSLDRVAECKCHNLLPSKMASTTFSQPFLVDDLNWGQKGQQKVAEVYLSFKRMPKKTPKRRQKVSNLFWTTKGSQAKKVGKKSWHLRSPLVKVMQSLLSLGFI